MKCGGLSASGSHIAYCASKGAVVALMQSLAADLAPEIRVNAVSAGQMVTEICIHMAEDKGIEPASPAYPLKQFRH